MEHLTNIVENIANIENRATTLIQQAEEEKVRLSKNQEERIWQFHQDLNQKTQEQIGAIQEKLKQQMEEELKFHRAKTNEVLEQMQQEFDEKHSQIAQQIVKSMIGA